MLRLTGKERLARFGPPSGSTGTLRVAHARWRAWGKDFGDCLESTVRVSG